jgi:Predicted transcriptional regulators
MDYKLMGKRIRKQRVYMSLTQEQLAERAGLSASFIGHIEQGSRVASIHTLVVLCRAMNITPNFVLQDSFENLTDSLNFPPNLSAQQITKLQEVVNTMTHAMDHWNDE